MIMFIAGVHVLKFLVTIRTPFSFGLLVSSCIYYVLLSLTCKKCKLEFRCLELSYLHIMCDVRLILFGVVLALSLYRIVLVIPFIIFFGDSFLDMRAESGLV